MQPRPHARVLPLPQPPPTGHPRPITQLLGQMLPRRPRDQDEEDPLKRPTVIQSLASGVPKPALMRGQKRRRPLPQPVGHLPPLRSRPPQERLPATMDAHLFALKPPNAFTSLGALSGLLRGRGAAVASARRRLDGEARCNAPVHLRRSVLLLTPGSPRGDAGRDSCILVVGRGAYSSCRG